MHDLAAAPVISVGQLEDGIGMLLRKRPRRVCLAFAADTVERGLDPRDLVMHDIGGTCTQQCGGLGEELNVHRIGIPCFQSRPDRCQAGAR